MTFRPRAPEFTLPVRNDPKYGYVDVLQGMATGRIQFTTRKTPKEGIFQLYDTQARKVTTNFVRLRLLSQIHPAQGGDEQARREGFPGLDEKMAYLRGAYNLQELGPMARMTVEPVQLEGIDKCIIECPKCRSFYRVALAKNSSDGFRHLGCPQTCLGQHRLYPNEKPLNKGPCTCGLPLVTGETGLGIKWDHYLRCVGDCRDTPVRCPSCREAMHAQYQAETGVQFRCTRCGAIWA